MTTALHPHQLELSTLKRSWVESAIPVVMDHIKDELPFVSDSLHGILPEPEENNWFGLLIAQMKRRGLIERTGYMASERPERNGAVIAIWRKKQSC